MDKYKEKTIDSYNKGAVIFSEKFKNLLDRHEYESKRFRELMKGKKILDLGCGAGDHALQFVKYGFDVMCVDLSKKMIELCKEKKLDAIQMDIENLKFNEDSFDGIWAVTSLLHVPKLRLGKVVKSIHKILKNEGVIYICMKEGKGENFETSDGYERFFAYWEKEELIKIFEPYFNFLEFRKVSLGNTMFLEFFFRKQSK